MFSFNDVNFEALQSLQDILPTDNMDYVCLSYGENLSDEMISQSIKRTCDFFNIEEPALVKEGWTTGLYPNNNCTLQDDVLIFNREQLIEMGILDKDALDLVMTHECTHRVLQGMEHLKFDSQKEELCCDYMAGVRAGLNGIDVSQMKISIMYTPESETHPAGGVRVDAIEAGIKFAQEYSAIHGVAPTFNDCLDDFLENLADNSVVNESINLRTEDISAYSDDGETLGSVAFVDNNFDENNATIKGYTSEEIKRNISKADSERRYHEGMVSHHTYMANHGLSEADTKYHLSEAGKHQRNADEWKSKAQKWRWTKPDK